MKETANGDTPGPSRLANGNVDSHKEGQKSDGAETTHSQSSSQSKKSKSSYDKLALSRTNISEMKLVGRGEFGDVMMGKISKTVLNTEKKNSAASTPTDEKDVHVLVKMLMQTKDEECLAEFKREIDIFSKLSHENVTKLFGLCRETEPHYMIFEYTDWVSVR